MHKLNTKIPVKLQESMLLPQVMNDNCGLLLKFLKNNLHSMHVNMFKVIIQV